MKFPPGQGMMHVWQQDIPNPDQLGSPQNGATEALSQLSVSKTFTFA